MMKYIYFYIIVALLLFAAPALTSAATLTLSPASGSYHVGDTITASIVLDAQGASVDGVDIYYLNYNPALLSVQDSNGSVSGVQIVPGTLMPTTTANIVDAGMGKIAFAQAVSGGGYTGSGTLATVYFTALAAGTASVTFDFTSGNTTDCNVASGGTDVLASVTNGAYTITVAPPPPPAGPSLTLAPASFSKVTGDAFAVNIMLDTAGSAIDGVDVYLNYDRNAMSVVDDDPSTDGVQITAGALLPNTARNEVGSYSKIFFSQTTQGTGTYSGSGVLATIHFRAIAPGETDLTFDFVAGKTSDTNISIGGADILSAVSNASVTVASNGLPPVVSNPQPSGPVSVSLSVTLSVETNEKSTCRYNTAPGTAYDAMPSSLYSRDGGVTHTAMLSSSKIQLGSNVYYVKCRDASGAATPSDMVISFTGVTDSAAPTILNPTPIGSFFMPKNIHISVLPFDESGIAACKFGRVAGTAYDALPRFLFPHRFVPIIFTNDDVFSMLIASRDLVVGQNNFYIRCKDTAGNVNTTDTVVSFTLLAAPTFTVSAEGVTDPRMVTFTLELFTTGSTTPEITVTTRPTSTGQITVLVDNTFSNKLLGPGIYDVAVSSDRYLKKKVSGVFVGAGALITLPELLAGDLNSDGIVNSLDWARMSADWGTSYVRSDINRDRRVNTVDWGYLRKNWMNVGD